MATDRPSEVLATLGVLTPLLSFPAVARGAIISHTGISITLDAPTSTPASAFITIGSNGFSFACFDFGGADGCSIRVSTGEQVGGPHWTTMALGRFAAGAAPSSATVGATYPLLWNTAAMMSFSQGTGPFGGVLWNPHPYLAYIPFRLRDGDYGYFKYEQLTPKSCKIYGWKYQDDGSAIHVSSPTLVILSAVSATRQRAGVTVRWQTSAEIDTVGFNLWRFDPKKGDYVKVNEHLIPSKGSPVAGARYEMSAPDDLVTSRVFRLQYVDSDGVTRWHGPFEAQ